MYQYIILPKRLSHSPAFSVKPTPVYSLWKTLHKIPDPRRPQGTRHPLPVILTLSILALCCGTDNYQAISEWPVNYQQMVRDTVPFLARHIPDPSTFHRVFSKIDVSVFESVIAEWIREVVPLEHAEGIALDGKTTAGNRLHLVTAFAHQARSVLFQEGTDTKGKELVVGPHVLSKINLSGHIVTGDAIFAQKKICKMITNRGGGFVFTVKDNQKTLHEGIKLFFEEPPLHANIDVNTTETHHKGRTEQRTAYVTEDLTEYIHWPGVTHVWKVVRERKENGKITREVAHGIACLFGTRDPAPEINEMVRGHWSIENNLHRQKDVVFNEDASTTRKGSAPQVMAALRNLVTTIFNRGSVRSFPTAFRRFAACPDELFEFLGLSAQAKAYAV